MELPVLWASEEDVQNRSWFDWLKAHASFMKPLHRFEGSLFLDQHKLILSGIDKRTTEDISIDIYKYQILQLYLGFDETFNIMETRDLGLSGFPIRLTYIQNQKEEKLYLIANIGYGMTSNKDCYEVLKNWIGI
jgi:hypothetical protein